MASSPEQTSEQQEPQQQSSSDQEKFHNMQNGGGAEEGVVDSAAQDSSKAPAGKSSSSGKIFIGGLSWETTTEKLTSHFKKYGEIIDSVIMKDRITGHPRGFGFVTYSDPSVCDRVMKDKHVLDGRTVEIKKSVPRESMVKGPRTKKIFVGGIPPTITEDEFKKYFTRFGTVVESQIMQDRGTGRSRGFGFVTFDTEQVVEDILLQGRTLELGGKQVEIKKAEPKKSIEESTPAYGPSYGRGEYGMGAGDYGGYGDGYSSFGGDTYRSGGGYGARGYGGRYDDGYGSGYYSGGGSMGAAYGGGPGSYGGLGGGGYGGSMMGRYGDADLYGGMGYGAYGGVDFGGYGSGGSYGGGYGGSRYGGGSSSGRYHPYGRH